MITTVIFDIGGVLTDYNWKRYIGELFPDPDAAEAVYDAFLRHGVWDEMDRGTWDEDRLREAYVSCHPAYEKEILLFFEKLAFGVTEAAHAKSWITSCRERGVRTLYLSNWSSVIRKRNLKVLDFLPLFDGGVFSYEEKLIKPERAIYETICSRYDLVPGECVFIDDNARNIAAAKEFGLNVIHYQTYEQASAALSEMLGGSL